MFDPEVLKPYLDKHDKITVDPETGLSLEIPLPLQRWPGWMSEFPEDVSRIRMLRAKHGIEVDDAA